MARKKQQIEVIEQNGAKTVVKKTSYITRVKQFFTVFTVIWLVLVIWAPMHVKNTYSEPIKKSIVVSMFFDLQRGIVEQYERLLDGVADAIDLDKPVAAAIDKVKMASNAVDKVTDATEKAKESTDKAKAQTAGVKKLTGIAGKFGIKTGGIDAAVDKVDSGIARADAAVAKVDNTAKLVNEKLDSVEKNLAKTLQVEFDSVLDAAIKKQLDKNSGGLGTTLLTNYGVKHVYPWRPSSWGVATKIYNDLEKSDVSTITIITGTVNKYFGYVAWGLVVAAWAIGILLWMSVRKKVKAMISPFIVCPRCGNTFADKRTALGILKVFQPWKWI